MGRQERKTVAEGARLFEAAQALLADHDRAVGAVRTILGPMLDAVVARELDEIPVARLQEVTQGGLRLAALENSGLRTVGQVLRAGPYRLRQIPGIGQHTAHQALAAAHRLAEAIQETVAVHIDVDHPEPTTTALVAALHTLVEAGPDAERALAHAGSLSQRLGPLLVEARPARSRIRLLMARQHTRSRAQAAVAEIRALTDEASRKGVPALLGQASVNLLRGPANDIAAWVDFELRSAEYYGQLAQISGRQADTRAIEGHLPAEFSDRVRAQALDDSLRRVSLRGYQAFGARFVLAQHKVILGDEMGLGKTIQAIAVLCHLAAEGQTHFMVVCPASVLVNWTREIEARSILRAAPLHGPDRGEAFADWAERGGVAITTFDALRGFTMPADGRPGMLVVDEAHYVKNPGAKRSQTVAAWTAHCERVLFMTGTPMENRVLEFRNLVEMLSPRVAESLGDPYALVGSVSFRRRVASVYLRRNQDDVLTELPSLQRIDEWEEPSASDLAVYREAVYDGNFMAMRRAAYLRPKGSAKLNRLREIVQEAGANGQKAVVFSYFREVLGIVAEALGCTVFGPITGSTAADRRQQIVDEFTTASKACVLLAQIQAGGVGINLQAASVVIICEPQLKPTTEHQAVARAHRMGQVRSVRVHRLLTTGGVDERLVKILRNKDRLFDAYARRSAVAEANPDAVDVSNLDIARRIVEEEQIRLGARATSSTDV